MCDHVVALPKKDKPPLVLTPSKPMKYWQEDSCGVSELVHMIISCPVTELRMEIAKKLQYAEIATQDAADRIERLHRAAVAAKESHLAAEVLSGYLKGARDGALAQALEYVLSCDGPYTARWLSKDICYKLVHQWYSADDLFTAIPSLAKYLELLIWGLDCLILRENKPEYVNKYFESCWVEARRAMQVLARFATASRAFLPQLETIQSRMKGKLIIPDEEYGGNRNPRMVRSLHMTELRYVIGDIRTALKRHERERASEAAA